MLQTNQKIAESIVEHIGAMYRMYAGKTADTEVQSFLFTTADLLDTLASHPDTKHVMAMELLKSPSMIEILKLVQQSKIPEERKVIINTMQNQLKEYEQAQKQSVRV